MGRRMAMSRFNKRVYSWTSDIGSDDNSQKLDTLTDFNSLFSPPEVRQDRSRINPLYTSDYDDIVYDALMERQRQQQELQNEQAAFQMYNFTLAFAAFLLCVSLMVVLMKKRIFRRGDRQINRSNSNGPRIIITTNNNNRRNNHNGRTSSEV